MLGHKKRHNRVKNILPLSHGSTFDTNPSKVNTLSNDKDIIKCQSFCAKDRMVSSF